MKNRIASSIALAAAILLGATGCGLAAPQGTTDPYAPSDGVQTDVAGVAVRNLMLIETRAGGEFNIVFTAVNPSDSNQNLRLAFSDDSGSVKGEASFNLEPGTNIFGTEDEPEMVRLPNVNAGSTVNTFVQVAGAADVEIDVPVLDGTLDEYKDLVH